jgi:peptidoglycan/xylan/chitin deacetylase (PgdA/CDA1 family)
LISNATSTLRLAKRVSRRAIMRPWRAHGLVLLYHRVAAAAWDPWNICVDPERFEQQLAELSRVADFVPLSTLASRLRVGRRGRPVVALTFDDGYADNLHVALPLLERYSAPATVFIATAWMDRGEPFWWDRLCAILLSIERLPSQVRLSVGGGEFIWQRQAADGSQTCDRDRLCLAVWSTLVVATDQERRAALDQLQSLADPGQGDDPAARPMTRDELRHLASSPLIEIGAHTMSHCRLPDLPPDAQLEEILGSRRQCRELTGELPSSFAYPFGALDTTTPQLVRSAGFERACSTQHELVWAGSDMMLLPRVAVPNYTAREFSARLRMEWLP